MHIFPRKGASMFYRLGMFATRYRWIIVGCWLLAFALALPFAPRADSVLQPGGFVSPDAESVRAITLLTQKLHLDQTIVQVIFTSQRYTADSPQFVQEFSGSPIKGCYMVGGFLNHQLCR